MRGAVEKGGFHQREGGCREDHDLRERGRGAGAGGPPDPPRGLRHARAGGQEPGRPGGGGIGRARAGRCRPRRRAGRSPREPVRDRWRGESLRGEAHDLSEGHAFRAGAQRSPRRPPGLRFRAAGLGAFLGRPQRQQPLLRRRDPDPGLDGGAGSARDRRLPEPREGGATLPGWSPDTGHNPHLLRRPGEEKRGDSGPVGATLPRCCLAGRTLQLEALGGAGIRSTYLRVREKESRGRRLRPPGKAARQRGTNISMGKRKSVPDDLMGTILSESFDAADEPQAPSESLGSPGAAVSWDEKAERVGIAFNLSKQLSVELERLRWELRSGEDVRPSKSEIAEVALRIAVEDVRERSKESELSRRLDERRVAQIPNAAGTTQRSVDESGWIFETTYDENGSIIDENVVCTVADLPVTDEYVDEQGRLVSVANDELGNTFEQIMDEAFNTLGTRLLRTSDQEAR